VPSGLTVAKGNRQSIASDFVAAFERHLAHYFFVRQEVLVVARRNHGPAARPAPLFQCVYDGHTLRGQHRPQYRGGEEADANHHANYRSSSGSTQLCSVD